MNLKPVVLLGSESVLKLKREERSVYSIITYMYIYIYTLGIYGYSGYCPRNVMEQTDTFIHIHTQVSEGVQIKNC